MVLSLEQIQSITQGAVSVTKDAGGIHFSRFTQAQKDTYGSMRDHFLTRATATAGCCLNFHTDAENMVLYVMSGSRFEVQVDGLPTHFFSGEGERKMPITLPKGDKHVIITLSYHTEAVLGSLTLDEYAYVRPHKSAMKMLFLGDSITQGSRSSRDTLNFSTVVARYFDAEMHNQGVGGSYMAASTLEDTGFDPDIVMIAYGTNDYTQTPSREQLEKDCKDYFDKVMELYGDKKVFFISPIYRLDGATVRRAGSLDDCRELFISEALARGMIHIDGYTLVPHMADCMADGYLHPNDMGFSYYAMNLIKELSKYI